HSTPQSVHVRTLPSQPRYPATRRYRVEEACVVRRPSGVRAMAARRAAMAGDAVPHPWALPRVADHPRRSTLRRAESGLAPAHSCSGADDMPSGWLLYCLTRCLHEGSTRQFLSERVLRSRASVHTCASQTLRHTLRRLCWRQSRWREGEGVEPQAGEPLEDAHRRQGALPRSEFLWAAEPPPCAVGSYPAVRSGGWRHAPRRANDGRTWNGRRADQEGRFWHTIVTGHVATSTHVTWWGIPSQEQATNTAVTRS